MSSTYKSYAEFLPLKTVMVGKCHSSASLNSLSLDMSEKTKSLFKQLLEETEEDLQQFISICKSYGAAVKRPEYSFKPFKTSESSEALGAGGMRQSLFQEYPYLLIPRNNLITLDDTVISINSDNVIHEDYINPISNIKNIRNKYTTHDNLKPSSIVRLGKDIIVDKQNFMNSNTEIGYKYLKDWLEPNGFNIIYTPYHNFKFADHHSHGDSTLAICKPGVLISHVDASSYTSEIFKSWDGFTISEDSSKNNLNKWYNLKNKLANYNFFNKKFNDQAFQHTIEKWFKEWVGYANETVFDINIFSLDENTVVVSNFNKEVFDFFKKHKIETVLCNFRHRYFWDAGWHCLTSDLEREGSCEQYL